MGLNRVLDCEIGFLDVFLGTCYDCVLLVASPGAQSHHDCKPMAAPDASILSAKTYWEEKMFLETAV
jgi:hypothetical protein